LSAKNHKPVAVPAATPTSGGVPLMVHFTDGGSYDPDGDAIVSWEWKFKGEHDGWQDYTPTQGEAWHTYTSADHYTAILRVTDSAGKQNKESIEIVVASNLNASPVAIAHATPTSGVAPLVVSFTATGSYDPDGSIVHYEWNFGDGVFHDYTSTSGVVDHTYMAGSYTAVLRVTDDDNAISTSSVSIDVQPSPTWTHSWGADGNDQIMAQAISPSGLIYATGYTQDSPGAADNVAVWVYDLQGNLVSLKRWITSGYEQAASITFDSGGNWYITGWTDSFGNGRQALLLKFDSTNHLLWQKIWGSSGSDMANSVVVDSLGDVYIVGATGSFDEGAFIVKYGSDGTMLWQKSFGTPGQGSYANEGALGSDESLYVTGYFRGNIFLAKISPEGVLLWQTAWGGVTTGGAGEDSEGTTVHVDGSSVYVAGTNGAPDDLGSAVLLKYTDSGALVWSRAWNATSGRDRGESISMDASGNLWVAGIYDWVQSNGSLMVLNYDPSGNLLSARTRVSTAPNRAWGSAITVLPDNTMIVSGFAPNANVSWSTTVGNEVSPISVSIPYAGDLYDISGLSGDVSGTYVSSNGATGTFDSGGGGYDALIMRIQ